MPVQRNIGKKIARYSKGLLVSNKKGIITRLSKILKKLFKWNAP
jgi:hypothetical protein